MSKSMPIDAKDAIADAILQGRFRYAARLLFLWRSRMTVKDEQAIREDIESYSKQAVKWEWLSYNAVVCIRYVGEVYSYREQDVTDERW